MESEIALLTDEDLRKKLRSFNLRDGPITKTTRKLFEKKLAKAMGLDKQPEIPSETKIPEIKTLPEQRIPDVNGFIESSTSTCCLKDKKDLQVDSINRDTGTFYGVCLQMDNRTDIDGHSSKTFSVFTDKSEALHCVKQNDGARFRAFSTKNEAEAFASGKLSTPAAFPNPNPNPNPNPRQPSQELPPLPAEPVSQYRGPKRGEITNIRKLIEKGEVDSVAKLIYSNPRYLISSGDTPVIIQEGCHYNGMHVAAKAGHKNVCKLLVETLSSDDFWKLIYPMKEKSVDNYSLNHGRKLFLLDLYLNTPDKGGCDTPLHFACKFGKADVVEYLLSCPGVERTSLNKDGKTAEQVICARISNYDEELRSRIQSMFHKPESVCVPILRSDDNCFYPKVGTPQSPNFLGNYESVVDVGSPDEPRYKVRAYAGPMSPQEAEQFCYALRSPRATPDKQAKFRNIKRSDCDKGLERVARKLAKSQNVLWCEYWKFLDCFTDFSTNEGLARLEKYLREKTEEYKSNAVNLLPKTPDSSKGLSNCSFRGCLSGDDVFDSSGITPRSATGRVCEKNATPCSRTKNVSIKNFRNRLNLDESPENNSENVRVESDVGTGSKYLNSNLGQTDEQNNDRHNMTTEHDISICQDQQSDKKGYTSSKARQSPISPDANSSSPECFKASLDISNCSEDSLSGLIPEFRMLSLDESVKSREESCYDSEISELSPTENQNKCVKENGKKIEDISLFIEGLQPSKVDLDVFRIIKTTTIDTTLYPYVSRWQKMVRSFSKTTRQAWPSPGSPRYYKSGRSIPKTWSC